MSSSSISSPSTLPKIYVKLIHININDRQNYNNQQELIPMIFVLYKKTILIPDFNIATILKLIDENIDIHAVEDYVRHFLFVIFL